MQRIRPESVSFPPGPFSRDILRQNSGPKIEYGMKPTPHYRYATARKQLKIAPHGSIADCREPERSSGCDRHTLFHSFIRQIRPTVRSVTTGLPSCRAKFNARCRFRKCRLLPPDTLPLFVDTNGTNSTNPGPARPGPRPRPGPTSIVTDSTQLSLRSTGADYPSTTPVPWMLQAPRTGDTEHYKPRNCVPRHQMQP